MGTRAKGDATVRRAAKPVDLTLEKEIQADVIELYERLGCIVMRTQQSFRRGSMRAPGTAGIPDLFVFPPVTKGTHTIYGDSWCSCWPFFHETKTPSGKQSAAQIKWQKLCDERRFGYVLGGTEAALTQLRAIGLLAAPGRS